jgi:O-antigen/teichoic acid export membrane protein
MKDSQPAVAPPPAGTGETSPRQANWRGALAQFRAEPSHTRILSGSVVMLIGSALVSSVNFGYNIAVARLLGPARFGHAAAAVTLLMMFSAITLAFQLVCAKFVARNATAGARAAVYGGLLRRAWLVGILLGSAFCLFSGAVAQYLNLPSGTLVIVLASGVAFYVPLGVKRGGLQGVCAFKRLAANFILEALVKFFGAILLIQLGWGVNGAVGAIAASVILAYLFPPMPAALRVPHETGVEASFAEGLQAMLFFVGQVVINNVDILLVKHFFGSAQAGVYAAVALVGRVVYFCAWSVISAMFPISAGSKSSEDNPAVLVVPLGIVLAIVVLFTLGLDVFPDFALRTIFGPSFQQAAWGLNSLLMLYAAATGAYSLAVVLMAYEMSRKLANSGWMQLAFSGAIVGGIYFFHQTLRDVVVVQLVLMVALLMVAALPFFRKQVWAGMMTPATASAASIGTQLMPPELPVAAPLGWVSVRPRTLGLKRLRRVAEAEVIADFLKNEFYHEEFHRDRDTFEHLVMHADPANEAENALRRALLFRRRGTMWRELPAGTEWWEVELSPEDIENLRVFPRAQWRKMASGNFRLTEIVSRIRGTAASGRTGRFISKLQSVSDHLRQHDDRSAILLIGIDEHHPLTIIEGNHRVTAARLASPELLRHRFRYFCGFSPRMTECCWYETNLPNLWRYACNRLNRLIYDREADIGRLHGGELAPATPGAALTAEAPRKQAS